MKSDYIIYGVLFIVVIILGYSMRDLIAENPVSDVSAQNNQNQNPALAKTTGNTGDGDVQIDVTSKGIVNGKLAFDFAANTHSVSLEQFDLKKLTSLSFNGKDYAPIAAPALSGHHNSGELVFDLNDVPNNFKIVIKGIPSVEERVFEWG
ncbi:MAG TPA: hypothetical protein VI564_05135 [Candidatus Nanoarchaeia archaeon]|nr:hypothetical protein [Candidatus Nanoarchaeia archaeon]